MSEFVCHRVACNTWVDCDDEDDLYEDESGCSAYCSDACYSQACTECSQSFNALRSLGFTYTVGNAETEAQLLVLIRQRNPFVAHSFDEGDYDAYPGGWHWFWVPDLEDLKQLSAELDVEDLSEIEHYDWEEFMAFSHPVKGIALVQAYDFLSSLSLSVYISKDGLTSKSGPSEPDFQV